ncbi:SCO2525 family SAM-dependent methyltransferase [Actinosynnema sp. NPDC020468]|uniref:SCO2525 family SAM-dependent methyltransferase n=1 Tax=Actinosynnema sp. NPDC020468 TaxID=3154488 RepID=UPI0033C27E77
MAQPNAEVDWSGFDPEDYLRHNYAEVGAEDRDLVGSAREFFGERCAGRSDLRGLDVGTGANLYPALSMLPYCRSLTLYEHSPTNVAWLREQVAAGWPSWSRAWGPFWALLAEHPAHAALADPAAVLARRAEVVRGSVFDLDPAAGGWDVGTMFFVAESISTERAEFTAAVRRFLGALRTGAPFFLAFMENSEGYEVGGVRFPAVRVDADDVADSLDGVATEVVVGRARSDGGKVRDGYTGMVYAHGLAR